MIYFPYDVLREMAIGLGWAVAVAVTAALGALFTGSSFKKLDLGLQLTALPLYFAAILMFC